MDSCISKEECICKEYASIPTECNGVLQIEEQGKKVKISLKSNENALFAIIDKCLITDNSTKSDAICLFRGRKNYSFLIELKGFGEVEKAFKQLSYTRDNRDEYKNIIECFTKLDNKKVYEKFVIVTNGILDKKRQEKLENENRIRVSILFSKDTTKIANLQSLI